jgi:uncharacterized protein (TIGR02118 family)
MLRILALLKKLPTISRDDFCRHYEGNHAPLALPLLEGIERYVRYHIEEDLHGEVGFDVITAFWYRDQAAADALFARLDGPEGKPIREDELRFMDKPGNRFFAVSERGWQAGDEGDRSTFVLVRRPGEKSREDASREIVRDHWPRLFEDPSTRGFALLRDGFGMAGGEPPYDSVMQLVGVGAATLEKWAGSLEAEGWKVVAVRTKRYETDLSA